MNPRAEAYERLGGEYEVRVLEPSPPAVDSEPWFADDPVEPGEVPSGRRLVSPIGNGDLRWEELAAGDAELAPWCEERWLGPYRRLAPAPVRLVETRLALHRLTEHVVSPARRHANGKIALRYTHGGFGTPFFNDDVQIRVEGRELVVQERSTERRATITTLAQAADHIGRDSLPADVEVDGEPLRVELEASSFLGDWYGFAASVLEELRALAGPGSDPSRVQLWPEHFDLAVELGSESDGARAAFGLSPGDEHHPEPYVYVAPWVAPEPGDLWQALGFNGAEMPYAALLEAADQRQAVLEFLRLRLDALASTT
jgi:hypothetical protein